MARTYLVFGDIEGKLDELRAECARCQRKGRYSVHRLIKKGKGPGGRLPAEACSFSPLRVRSLP
jgi:hypothetical protein